MRRPKDVPTRSRSKHHEFLSSLLNSERRYPFNSLRVCHEFLRKAFRFSSEVVTDVARAFNESSSLEERYLGSAPSRSHSSCPTEKSSNRNASVSSRCSTGELMKLEAILSFLRHLAEDCGENMPDKNEIHLPFDRRKELYPLFVTDFNRLYPETRPASPQYFRRVWKYQYPHVKVLKTMRFTTCERCDELRRNMRAAAIKRQSTEAIKDQQIKHLEFVRKERLEYQAKKDRGRLESVNYLSVILDGADQSTFGMPHFTTNTKSQRGHALKLN